jgi:NitT/TauT family transport system permease protein
MMDSRWVPLAIAVGTVAGGLAAWQVLSSNGYFDPQVLPPPTRIIAALWQLIDHGLLWPHVEQTMVAFAGALLIGTLIGLVAGITLALSQTWRLIAVPFIDALQGLPRVVLAPLFITILGFGVASTMAIGVALCFYPVLVNTVVGLDLAGSKQLVLFRALRASRWQTLWKLRVPVAAPMLFAGVKQAALLAFTGVIAGELLAGSAGGIGYLVRSFTLQIEMAFSLASTLVVVLAAVAILWVFERLEQRLARRGIHAR